MVEITFCIYWIFVNFYLTLIQHKLPNSFNKVHCGHSGLKFVYWFINLL